jgi:hypothetical protein
MPHGFDSHLGVGIGAIATGKQTLLAEPAFSAADRERHDNPIAYFKICHGRTKLNDLAHVLVAKDIALLHRRLVAVKQMEVRATDGATRYLDDRVAGMLNLGVWNGVDTDVAFSMPA